MASSTHLALELFKSLAKVNIEHIPYTGSPQVVTDLLAGRLHGYFSPASTVMGQVRAGKLVALATTDPKRGTIIPDLPTMVEAGVPDCVSVLWFGLVAPAGTPRPIIDRLAAAANEALKQDEVKTSLRAQTVEAHGGTPDRLPQAHGKRTQALDRGGRSGGLAEIAGLPPVADGEARSLNSRLQVTDQASRTAHRPALASAEGPTAVLPPMGKRRRRTARTRCAPERAWRSRHRSRSRTALYRTTCRCPEPGRAGRCRSPSRGPATSFNRVWPEGETVPPRPAGKPMRTPPG